MFMGGYVYGACNSISRVNAGPNSVLTSTKYNGDLNTVYAHTNNFDGECITANTIPFTALSLTDFDVLLNAPKEGCKITKSDAATIAVGECRLAINGAYVTTTTTTTETWGCSGCSAEANSTVYYVYAADGSSGSTLNILISTTAPGEDGYDGSNNRVIGKFFNNSSGDIEDEVKVWTVDGFRGGYRKEICTVENNGSSQAIDEGGCSYWVTTIARQAGGHTRLTLTSGIYQEKPVCTCTTVDTTYDAGCSMIVTSSTQIDVYTFRIATAQSLQDRDFAIVCLGGR